ncbi:REP-associated tyrosine transposase [Denitromonas sp.]|uniref:REP-associated tyrosine transposase n=1 Tax=Denitromonas sp. TaxID=2734609 RepID=UPI003A884810
MPNYRRNRVPGGTYFFTVTLADRRSHALTDHVEALREAVRRVQQARPLRIDAWVVLPDHLHAIWTLPEGDADYSSRWREIKKAFTRAVGGSAWQRGFWEHTLRDERDYTAHVDYVHINPLKHGLVERVRDWPYSSFHRAVAQGVYPADWAGDGVGDIAAGDP